jgi:DNA-binding SARP family transcriptional activator
VNRLRSPGAPGAGRRGEITSGLAALVVLFALVVGLPVALWLAVGWPLPRGLPSLNDLQAALARDRIPDDVLVKAVAVAAWLAWAQFVACVLVELVAGLRGRLPARVPLAALNQALARRLIAAVLVLSWPSGGAVRATAAPADLAAARQVAVMADAPSPLPPAAAELAYDLPTVPATSALRAADAGGWPGAPEVEPQADHRPRVYTVQAKRPGQPRDTLWRVAEVHLGDPLRWRELWELNAGRPLPDGRRLEDPDWIYPGCTLLMPADAVGLPPERPGGAQAAAGAQAQAGRHAPAPVEPDARAGEHLAAAATDLPEMVRDQQGVVEPTPRNAAPAPERPVQDEPLALLVLAAGGLLAAGVVARLGRLRRAQQRRRRTGTRIPLPGPEPAHVERVLRALQEPETARFLDLALRALAAGLQAEERALPQVLGVELARDRLDVLLADPAPPPAGWSLVPGERRWRLPAGVPPAMLERSAAGVRAPLPGLATIGTSPEGLLLLNLEQPEPIVLAGAQEPVGLTLDVLAVELATGPWAGSFELLLGGFGERGLRVLDHVREFASVEELLAAERARPRAGGMGPRALVLCAERPTAEQLDRLAALPGTAVVAAGDAGDASWAVTVADDRVDVGPLGLRVRPWRLPRGQVDALAELLGLAAADSGGGEVGEPEPAAGLGTQALFADDDELDELQQPPVEVRVLGPVDLSGAQLTDGRPGRGKADELIAYLALNPDGAEPGTLAAVLWPGDPVDHERLRPVLALARETMGRAPDGSTYLFADRHGRYRLHPTVRLDWARFWTLSRHTQPGLTGIPVLHNALALVRGLPFEGAPVRSYGWAQVAHRPIMEATIVDAAEDLARRYLEAADPAGAAWAVRKGLAVSPYDERLYRLLLLAAALAGDPSMVDSAMHELVRRFEDSRIEPFDSLEDEMAALYEQLGRNLRLLGSASP